MCRRTKVDNIEHFRTPILRDAGKELPVRASGNSNHRCEVSTVCLDKLDALLLLFPQLDNAVD